MVVEKEVMDEQVMVEEKKKSKLAFEDLGLVDRLVRALHKENITKPTPIQCEGIPLILEGKDVVARANTGSGKTYTYVLPLLQKLLSMNTSEKTGPRAIILVPTRELCQQVCKVVQSVLDYCHAPLKVAKLLNDMRIEHMKTELSWNPEILVSTPACISTCLSRSVIQGKSLQNSLSMLVLDEGDLLLSFGYESDIKSLIPFLPLQCQRILMTASPSETSTGDVEKLKKLVLQNPFILTLTEEGNEQENVIPNSIQQFSISCKACDKMLHILALLKLEIILKKVLIFVNSIDMAYRLKLFLEQFGIKSAVLNAELPQNSRLHILEQFNAGCFDYLIATDFIKTTEQTTGKNNNLQSKHSKKHSRQKVDSEFGVVRGIDFKNVFTVINYDMPLDSAGYVHRIGRTGRAHSTGSAICLVCPEDAKVYEEIKILFGNSEDGSSSSIAPYPYLKREAVEALRYRAEDIGKGVTKIAIRESRAKDLRKEILNSEKLKAHFEDNPRDLELLKHDKELSNKPPPPHLRTIPDYLLDSETQKASKFIKLTQAAMTTKIPSRKKGSKRSFGRSKDPLRSLSIEKKRARNGEFKKKGANTETRGSKKSKI